MTKILLAIILASVSASAMAADPFAAAKAKAAAATPAAPTPAVTDAPAASSQGVAAPRPAVAVPASQVAPAAAAKASPAASRNLKKESKKANDFSRPAGQVGKLVGLDGRYAQFKSLGTGYVIGVQLNTPIRNGECARITPEARGKASVVASPCATVEALEKQAAAKSGADVKSAMAPSLQGSPKFVKAASPQDGKSLDDIISERQQAECSKMAFLGFVCNEKVRVQVCDGHWNANPPAGEKSCTVAPPTT